MKRNVLVGRILKGTFDDLQSYYQNELSKNEKEIGKIINHDNLYQLKVWNPIRQLRNSPRGEWVNISYRVFANESEIIPSEIVIHSCNDLVYIFSEKQEKFLFHDCPLYSSRVVTLSCNSPIQSEDLVKFINNSSFTDEFIENIKLEPSSNDLLVNNVEEELSKDSLEIIKSNTEQYMEQ